MKDFHPPITSAEIGTWTQTENNVIGAVSEGRRKSVWSRPVTVSKMTTRMLRALFREICRALKCIKIMAEKGSRRCSSTWGREVNQPKKGLCPKGIGWDHGYRICYWARQDFLSIRMELCL
jgi:hypothetical protein